MPGRMFKEWLSRQVKFRILHVEDSAHRVALAVGLAVAVVWTPAIGLHLLIYLLLAWLCRANMLVGIPFILLSNPLTLIPVYYPNYLLGRWMLGISDPPGNFLQAINLGGGYLRMIQTWWSATAPYMVPLWAGSLVMCFPMGLLAYGLVFHAMRRYQQHHPELTTQAQQMRHPEQTEPEVPSEPPETSKP